jgi:hypothetical protein
MVGPPALDCGSAKQGVGGYSTPTAIGDTRNIPNFNEEGTTYRVVVVSDGPGVVSSGNRGATVQKEVGPIVKQLL